MQPSNSGGFRHFRGNNVEIAMQRLQVIFIKNMIRSIFWNGKRGQRRNCNTKRQNLAERRQGTKEARVGDGKANRAHIAFDTP